MRGRKQEPQRWSPIWARLARHIEDLSFEARGGARWPAGGSDAHKALETHALSTAERTVDWILKAHGPELHERLRRRLSANLAVAREPCRNLLAPRDHFDRARPCAETATELVLVEHAPYLWIQVASIGDGGSLSDVEVLARATARIVAGRLLVMTDGLTNRPALPSSQVSEDVVGTLVDLFIEGHVQAMVRRDTVLESAGGTEADGALDSEH